MINNTFQKNNIQNVKGGFTLIEMLVSIALFSIVVTIAMGSIFTIIDASRKSQTLTLVMNNLNFALEIMTRDIKTADPKTLVTENSGDVLSMKDQDGDIIRYRYSTNDSNIEKSVNSNGYYTIISDKVVVEKFHFQVLDQATAGGAQPRVVLIVNGYAQITERIRSDFNIQTTVSPRGLNI
jgi:type II secretion system protein J